jgi:hypothetical protein
MAENTKMPPNQDQRQRKPGDVKPQKPGGPVPTGTGPDRDRQGGNQPGRPQPTPEIDPDRDRPDRNKPIPDDLDDDDRNTGPIDRE